MKPTLIDRYILNTRPRGQAAELSELLISRGARVLEVPGLELRFLAPEEICSAPGSELWLRQIEADDWVFFTSVNGVAAVAELCLAFPKIKLAACACIGEQTGEAARSAGMNVSFVSKEAHAEAFAEEFLDYLKDRRTSVSVRASIFRPKTAAESLSRELECAGAHVRSFTVYENRMPLFSEDELKGLCCGFTALQEDERFSIVVFTSSESAKNIVSAVKNTAAGQLASAFETIPAAVIGPKTAQTAHDLGFKCVIESPAASIEELVRVIESHAAGASACLSGSSF